MKKRGLQTCCRKLLAGIALSATLFSCVSEPIGPYQYGELNTSAFKEVVGEGYYKVGSFDNFESNGRNIDTKFTSIFQSGNINVNMPSTGAVPLLVVPIDFSDRVGNSNDLQAIEKAFNGNRAANQFLSVAEYYEITSQSRLHLKPRVVNGFFRSASYPSVSSLSSISSSSATTSALTKIYEEAVDWLKTTQSDIAINDYCFTSTANKRVLPIYFIYTAPYAGENSGAASRNNMLWAFTINRPAPIAWSSVNMLHESQGKVDAHTFIHETGHLFGLEDYYDTSSTESLSRTSHLGRMDMMDSSLGDHNAFSKMLLDWSRPFVPTSNCEITIHQSSGNNEAILVSPNWNKTPYDSYLLLEFYTPTNINYTDAFLRSDETMRLFQKPGVKIYSVNAGLDLYNGYYSTGKALDEYNYNGGRLYFSRRNSSFASPLIQLLNKHQNNASPTPYFIASDHEQEVAYYQNEKDGTLHLSDALFYEGEGIDANHFSDLRFNGTPLGWGITVKKLTSSYATIAFKKV